ncbi:class I SAM-dependent methyltransferase [Nonomuraea basaltis]|uniref:class I SAM-dependent methyltransferase n=1 Tax=Nonomuraea basaltis TaxID=2495887 RepID=UPI00110C5AA3|nr:class I SAM-dependent methyltransferase [Nonomuraea basaltis]TMR99491.1 class I SAM-dependent methyltransferase [Nonomuraea basaltis]
MTANPFLDPNSIRSNLYGDAARITQRTTALRRAKTAGRHPADVIADLASTGPRGTVVDIGCGRGTTTLTLAQRLAPPRLIGFDQSAALLTVAARRLAGHGCVEFLQGDFHAIALADASAMVTVAAFCLYHSPCPASAVAEIARCLAPGGISITVTKSADSYQTLNEAITASGLDPGAGDRPSLYATFHSRNQADIVAGSLQVQQVIHDEHRFRFADADHIAAYAATTPRYELPGTPAEIAERLKASIGNGPLETTSTVTYVVATRS